jgi:hypothetical protein
MSVYRWVPSSLGALVGLYCLVWAILAASFAARERGGAAFFGVMLLLLALVYVRVIPAQE